jgi:T-complex protein 1 subunit alpha
MNIDPGVQEGTRTESRGSCEAALTRAAAHLAQVRDNVAAGVLEPALSKTKMIQFATEAAITILRIDDLITLAPSAEEEG